MKGSTMYRLMIVLFILLTLAPPPANAQSNAIPIAPCLPTNITAMEANGITDFVVSQAEWRQVFKHNEHEQIVALEGEQIGWLGYAPKGQESKEWYGQEYGFAGVNMFHYGELFILTFYDNEHQRIGRVEVREYRLDNTYILFFTTLTPFGLKDGSRYAHHIYSDKRGGACMFKVNGNDFREALGWN